MAHNRVYTRLLYPYDHTFRICILCKDRGSEHVDIVWFRGTRPSGISFAMVIADFNVVLTDSTVHLR
jgi:hypothetical protein